MDALRSTLQPVTRSLPAPVRDLGISLLGQQCYTSLIHDVNLFSDAPCLKFAVSKGLGLAIVAGASVVKVPQILKLLSSRSSAGVSFLSYALETTSFLITLVYSARQGFPFSTYGETALIAAQNVAISLLVLRFSGQDVVAAGWVAGLAAAVYMLTDSSIVDASALRTLQALSGVMAVGSKIPQIVAVARQGGTGQLSAFAVFNYLFGSLARVYTTVQEVDDNLILYGFIAGLILNTVLAGQMIYYWNSPASAPHAAEMGKKPEQIAMGSTTGGSGAGGVGASTSATPRTKGPSTRRRG